MTAQFDHRLPIPDDKFIFTIVSLLLVYLVLHRRHQYDVFEGVGAT